ncbi:LCP family protein [Streptomyces sp. NPDC048604]|uniref:LCP family protein n=1 Tax=Streptomyces sp. NPDC048604 TaxID=3365578 RepID=UPI00372108F7
MGQSSVRGEGARERVPRAGDRGWDDSLYEDAGTMGLRVRPGSGDGGSDDAGGGTSHRRGGPRRRAKKSGKRKIVKWVAATVSLLILGTAGAGYWYYEHLNGNLRSGGRSGGDSGVKKAPPNALGNTPLNILLIGSDSRADPKNVALGGGKNLREQKPLADVQMLLHISADRKNASAISIPRDTIVKIPECKDDKGQTYAATSNRPINESLQRGGPGCTLTTWETLTGVYVDHWMMIDFAGVVSMADEVGGVPVCVETGVHDKPTRLVPGGSGLQLRKGTTDIQGEQALQWLRTRHAWGNDQGRAKAQHMYMNGMFEKLQKQNAWSDTGQLLGLAETATKALQVSDELASVKALFDLSMQLKNVKLNRMTTATVPTVAYRFDDDRLEMVPSSADKIFRMIREDVAMDKNGDPKDAKPSTKPSTKPGPPAAAPGSLGVTVINGTGSETQAPVGGRARSVSDTLKGKGFTRANSSQGAEPRKDSVVKYPKSEGEQGKADAVSVATALGMPATAVRADATVDGITVVVGGDWREGAVYKPAKTEAGDLPDGSDVVRADEKHCMPVYGPYRWDGKS